MPPTDNQMEQSVAVEETSVAAETVVPMIQDTFDNQFNLEQQQKEELQPHVDSYNDDGTYQNGQFGVVPVTTAASTTTKVPKERWHWAYNRVVQVKITAIIRFLFVKFYQIAKLPPLIDIEPKIFVDHCFGPMHRKCWLPLFCSKLLFTLFERVSWGDSAVHIALTVGRLFGHISTLYRGMSYFQAVAKSPQYLHGSK